jgi:DNA-binding MarR family transcriptional regulator
MVNDMGNGTAMPTSKRHDGAIFTHKGDESHLLREIVRTHQVLMAIFSRKVGVPASRLALMRLLANADGGIGVMDLARRLGINAAAITRQVKEMEVEGVVQRLPDLKDGRRNQVRLSPEGRTSFTSIHERGHELEAMLSSGVSPGELSVTIEVLAKLRSLAEGLMKGRPL